MHILDHEHHIKVHYAHTLFQCDTMRNRINESGFMQEYNLRTAPGLV